MPVICDKDNLIEINKVLQKVEITTGDYKQTLDFIDENTFVYIDLPYRQISGSSSFSTRTQFDFTEKELDELVNIVKKLNYRKVETLTSIYIPKVDADFIKIIKLKFSGNDVIFHEVSSMKNTQKNKKKV